MHPALLDLVARSDLANTRCADCASPHPQWASVSFAVFLCLQCAGVHRGFGVHISFVRSISMDAWQSDQLRRMQLGGNAPFRDFLRSYPDGGYSDGMDTHALYHCWAAAQYREKLDCALDDRPWAPSRPPAALLAVDAPSRPASAQGLRKSRASARSPPVPASANEAYFASLGQANAARPADLPPSQGGRYQGFGNTPASQHPSAGLTSAAAPSLADFQENPAAALSKGWSLFSAVVGGATRAVNESVIQPGMERVMDPNLHASVRGYVSEAHKRAHAVGQSVNQWSKTQLGVDVADQMNGIVTTVKDKIGPGPAASGYGSLPPHEEDETLALYDDTNDFFHEYSDSPTASSPPVATQSVAKAKKQDDWDEWKDF